jgi:hypothetical protein
MRSSVAVAFLYIFFGPFGVFCLVWAFIFVGRAQYMETVVALGSAVFSLGLVAMVATVASRKVTPRVTYDDAGVMVRPDHKVDGFLMASSFGGFLAMTTYAVLTPLGMLDIPVPRNDERYFVIVCAAGALVGVFSVRQMIMRRGTSYLRLTVDGVETGNTVTSAQRSWDEVTDVADRPRKGRKSTGTTYITTADGHTRVLPSDWYTPGGHALREFVRFYWRHPEHRTELADGRAVERLTA